MANVLLIILLIISIVLIGLILIQRSEGGALGIGGGGGGGGLMSGRGTADLVTRMTGILGAAFLVVCMLISVAFNLQPDTSDVTNTTGAEEALIGEETAVPVPDTMELSTDSEKTGNLPLNEGETSGNDTTPLEEDSTSTESDAKDQENPQEN